jgi:Tn3 transposase DDE domain
MLALHLLQKCMVYINTLMMQQVLARPHWTGRLTPTDLRAVTPLIWEHVNPYGRFDLDVETRLESKPLDRQPHQKKTGDASAGTARRFAEWSQAIQCLSPPSPVHSLHHVCQGPELENSFRGPAQEALF